MVEGTGRVAPPQVQGGMAQTSRDSHAAVIPQPVTARTRRAGRSGTRRARGYGGRGAPAGVRGCPPRQERQVGWRLAPNVCRDVRGCGGVPRVRGLQGCPLHLRVGMEICGKW